MGEIRAHGLSGKATGYSSLARVEILLDRVSTPAVVNGFVNPLAAADGTEFFLV